MSSNISYRILHVGDWQQYKEAYLEWLENNPTVLATRYENGVLKSEQDWQEMFLNPKLIIWGCFIHDKLAAIASIAHMDWSTRYPEPIIAQLPASVRCERCYLSTVYNRPDYRGNGRMFTFIQHIIDYHHENKVIALIVEANNLPAIKLYQKLGFVSTANLPPRVMADNLPHPEYLMELILQ